MTGKESFTAVYDSGIGGISVLTQAVRVLPQENFLFFADNAHAPYGNRQKAEVTRLAEHYCTFFAEKGAKAIVIACNTATSAAAETLRKEFDIPVLGIEPALKPAVLNTSGQIIVMGTSLTIAEEKYRNLLQTIALGRNVVSLPCPGLMELVEKDPESPETEACLLNLLAPYAGTAEAIVLGCTHYPFLKPLLQKNFPNIKLFDGAEGVTRHLKTVLTEKRILGGSGRLEWDCSSEDPEEKSRYIEKCLSFYERFKKG